MFISGKGICKVNTEGLQVSRLCHFEISIKAGLQLSLRQCLVRSQNDEGFKLGSKVLWPESLKENKQTKKIFSREEEGGRKERRRRGAEVGEEERSFSSLIESWSHAERHSQLPWQQLLYQYFIQVDTFVKTTTTKNNDVQVVQVKDQCSNMLLLTWSLWNFWYNLPSSQDSILCILEKIYWHKNRIFVSF